MKKTFVFVFLLVSFFSFVHAEARTTDKETLKIQREEFQSAVEERRHSFFDWIKNVFSKEKINDSGRAFAALSKESLARMRLRLTEEKASFAANAEKRRRALAAQFGERKTNRIEDAFLQMNGSFEAAILSLSVFADRIQEKIDEARFDEKKNEALGERLADARTHIQVAEDTLHSLRALYEAGATSTDFKRAFGGVSDQTQILKDAIVRAQNELILLVRDLKKYEKEKSIGE